MVVKNVIQLVVIGYRWDMTALGLTVYTLAGDNLSLMCAALLSRVLCFFLL